LLDSEGCFLHITDSSLSFLSGSYSRSTTISPRDDSDYDLDLKVFLKPQDSEHHTQLEDVARAFGDSNPKKSQTSQDNTNLDFQQ
jgi:hypothetical protein